MIRALLAAALTVLCVPAAEAFEGGLLGDPQVLLPEGPAQAVVVLFSDADGWSAPERAEAARLRAHGAAVVGVDAARLLPALDRRGAECVYLVSDIERLGREIRRETGASAFDPPLVAGLGLGGALALDILSQTPHATLRGAAAADPAAGAPLRTPLCTPAIRVRAGEGWAYPLDRDATAPAAVALSDQAPPETQARAAAAWRNGALAPSSGGAPAEALAAAIDALLAPEEDGPGAGVVALPAVPTRDTLAVVISGDGGWRDIDRQIAGALQRQGVPTLGIDALRWFWSPREPAETAAALDRLITRHARLWGVGRVALVGYSFGANVLPEIHLALPERTRERVALISLLALGTQADWEITVAGWLGGASRHAQPVGPALRRLPADRVQCVHGQEEPDSGCRLLDPARAEVIETRGGHHFDGDYEALARHILRRLPAAEGAASYAGDPEPRGGKL